MPKPTYIYNAAVLKVIDGDTVAVTFDLGFHIFTTVRLRLLGINAPEVSTQEGRDARDFLKLRLQEGDPLIVTTFKDPGDKYGRWLATLTHNGQNVNKLMVDSGHAVPFMI